MKNGATTVWERWNSYSEDAGFGPVGMNSFNHYAYGAIMEWMYAYMAGIARDPDGPGFKRFVLQPHLDPTGRTTRVSGTYASPYGEIRSAWEVGGGGRTLTYEVVVPPRTARPPCVCRPLPRTRSARGVPRWQVWTACVSSATRTACPRTTCFPAGTA